jgi:hypothetical protein
MSAAMSLQTAHRVLIVAAIAAFAFYGAFGLRRALMGGGPMYWGFAVGSLAASTGFAVYLRAFNRSAAEHAKRIVPRARSGE